jgi:hypothetical protein
LALAAMTGHDELRIARCDKCQFPATAAGSSCRHQLSVTWRCRRPVPSDRFRPIVPMFEPHEIA